MAKFIVKSKDLDLSKSNINKISIGRFYSGDRFYTLLNEYLDKNLSKKNKFMAWIIKILFKSSNFKHDPGIANGQPLSVKLFDWFCIICLIIFIILCLGIIGTLIPIASGLINGKLDTQSEEFKKFVNALIGVGVPAIVTGIPAIFWLVIYFCIRKKNKPLTLQAYVEKKISWCLKLRFLIKNIKLQKQETKAIYLLENFEAQGAQAPRWLNIQLINLICSIFPDFDYVFRFENLTDEELAELQPIMDYDFRKIELINAEDLNWDVWTNGERKKIFSRKTRETKVNQNKTKEVKTEANETNEDKK